MKTYAQMSLPLRIVHTLPLLERTCGRQPRQLAQQKTLDEDGGKTLNRGNPIRVTAAG